jgi:hypothetical protein
MWFFLIGRQFLLAGIRVPGCLSSSATESDTGTTLQERVVPAPYFHEVNAKVRELPENRANLREIAYAKVSAHQKVLSTINERLRKYREKELQWL